MALVVSGNTTESAAWNTRRHRHTTRHACSVIIHTVTIQSDNEYEEPTQWRWQLFAQDSRAIAPLGERPWVNSAVSRV